MGYCGLDTEWIIRLKVFRFHGDRIYRQKPKSLNLTEPEWIFTDDMVSPCPEMLLYLFQLRF